jgi:hypothetical protein
MAPTPHPLVVALAVGLGRKLGRLGETVRNFNDVEAWASGLGVADVVPPNVGAEDAVQASEAVPPAVTRFLRQRFLGASHLPELVAILGYYGGDIDRVGETWAVFFLDAKLVNWLLVKPDDIVAQTRLTDEREPFGGRDVIWLKTDAPVTTGTAQPTVEEIAARKLSGRFVTAGDFVETGLRPNGSGASGIFCDATTPSCCRRPGTPPIPH